jgi:hypothetical protein
MKFLWDEKLKINTVHVRDVAKALWHLSQKGTIGNIYNLCDKGETGTVPPSTPSLLSSPSSS